MKKTRLEDLPLAVKNNVMTKEEAARIIWEEIYTNPRQYGLKFFTEDQKSELLLNIHKDFEKIFDKFIPGTVSFKNFLIGCISKHKKHFLKSQLNRSLAAKSLELYLQFKSEEEQQKYIVNFSESQSEPKKRHDKVFSDITEQEVQNFEQKNKRIAKITALVLLLKACKDIDDDSIESVCNFTGIDKDLLYEKIQELKESVNRKDELQQGLISRRNNSYFYHRRYLQEMLTLTSSDSALLLLRKKYENRTKRWEEQNKNLSVRSVTPSNEEIAKILGIKPRMVSFYINHAKKLTNRNKIKEMVETEEKTEEEKTENSQKNKK